MMEIEDLKALKSSLSFWQDDYDPVDDAEQHELFGRTIEAIEELIHIRMLENKPCQRCNGTGMEDSGGFQPWGEPIFIKCQCCGGNQS